MRVTSTYMNINIKGDCELIKIIATLCNNIQSEYDISPETLSSLINDEEYMTRCKFLYDQCYVEMLRQINQFKSQYNIDTTEVSGEEYEKCGYLLNSHQNNYVSYCNLHKYLHPHPNMLCSKDKNCGIDHTFVSKTQLQINKEKYFATIHLIYQGFINKVYDMLKKLFVHLILTVCYHDMVKITNESIAQLTDDMKKNTHIFKSKIIYQQHLNSKDKFYYIKRYRLN